MAKATGRARLLFLSNFGFRGVVRAKSSRTGGSFRAARFLVPLLYRLYRLPSACLRKLSPASAGATGHLSSAAATNDRPVSEVDDKFAWWPTERRKAR